jgi:hypothetical protein
VLRVKRQTENTISSARRTYSTPEGDEPDWDCDICMRPTTRRCNICSKGFFCSDSCQEKRSGSHLFTCSKRPLTSADYLWESLADDLMPQDEDVLEDEDLTTSSLAGTGLIFWGSTEASIFPASSQRRTYMSGVLGASWSIRSRSSITAFLRIPVGNTFPGF